MRVYSGWHSFLLKYGAEVFLEDEVSSVRSILACRRSGCIRSEVVCSYTGCPRRNVPDFGRVFLMLNYTDITQNTYAQN